MEPRSVANSAKPPCAATLKDLISHLHRVFEDDHINVEYVHELMSSYQSNPKEWQQYAKFDRHRPFCPGRPYLEVMFSFAHRVHKLRTSYTAVDRANWSVMM
ncbi:hypothetical protein HPB49_008632 [Dermacentor silvarum]|uniref:Uncharacterized protein n=1 Tax=Dermacentor silvarum TaxID=543639 RepID=A0ACB8CK67_DERSI|nr:hypothetical protein HPB49_008632 [Dermacentor silvarum]